MIVESPLKNLAPRLLRPDPERPKDHVAAALWMAVGGVVATVDWLLNALGEWHVETVDSAGTTIPHRLGRRPFGRVIVRQDGNRTVYEDYEQWNSQKIVLRTGAGSFEVAFFLFVALMALAAPASYAAECASYGYTQGDVVRMWVCEAATDTTTGAAEGDYRYNKDTNAAQTFDGATWSALGGSGAPTAAQYWTGAADAGLSAEHNLGLISTGLVLNTAGTPSAYAGTSCTNQFPRSLSASGAATCASVASADLSITGTTCTNQFMTAISSSAAGTCTTATLAGAQFANQGTTATVLHGNAAGNPSWGAVALSTDVSGDLPLSSLAQASGASVILGRGSAAGAGDYQEITLGTGLSMAGTVLSGTGGSTPTGTGFRHVTSGSEDAASVLVTLTSATHVAANQGTTTTVLHGNAAGQASFAAVDLTNDTSSVLPLSKLTDDASSGLCLLSGGSGDPAWTTCPGGGGGLSYAQVSASALAGF